MEKYNLDLIAKELLSYFKDKDTLENYWHAHSRREIDKFAQSNFKVSYFILGCGNLFRGQILRGLLFLIFKIIYLFLVCCIHLHFLNVLNSHL